MSNASSDQPDVTNSQPKIRAITWSPVSAVAFTVLVYFAAQLIGIRLVKIYPILKHWTTMTTNNWIDNSVIAQFVYALLAEGLTILFLWLFLRRHKVTFRVLGLIRPKLEDIGYALGGLVIYFPAYIAIVMLLSHFIHQLNVSQPQQIGFQYTNSHVELLLVFLSLVILPPIVEEIMFRGFLYGSLKKKLPVLLAALLTSVIFAAPHLLEGGNGGLLWIAGIDTFILSLVLVWLRQKTGRLYASMGLHALKNGIAFASLFLLHLH